MISYFFTEINHSVEHKRMTWIYYTDNFSGFNEIIESNMMELRIKPTVIAGFIFCNEKLATGQWM